jgi:hypothetical protein
MNTCHGMLRGSGCVLVVAALLAGCGSEPPPPAHAPPAPPTHTTAAKVEAAAPEPPPRGSLRRADVHRVVAAGFGRFLQRVVLDEKPVMRGGKFVGFRIVALSGDPSFWQGVDLKAGDVVTRVNGFPVEHPEEALEAFRSLEVASELRVGYERDGVAREIRYSIVE